MRISASPIELNATTKTDPARIDKVARQLEGQFAQMLVKSMREASFGDSLFPGENQTFRDMYDQQLTTTLTEGKGLGLSAIIARQLGGGSQKTATGTVDTSIDGAQAAKAYSLVAGGRESQIQATPTQSPLDQLLDMIAGRTSATSARPVDATALGEVGGAAVSSAAKAAATALGERTPEGFVARIWDHAQAAARELGVDPRALVAQAALETGWGRKGISRAGGGDSNNLFGIKASGWNGDSVTASTHEYVDGVRTTETAAFRAYDSPEQSFADYVRLLKTNPRYQQALQAGTDIRRFAQGLQRAGYATDPAYAAKITAIASGPTIGRAVDAIASATTRNVERIYASNADLSFNALLR